MFPTTSTIRVRGQFHSGLRKLAEQEGYRRGRKMELFNEGYARLREDPKAWKEELAEGQLWDRALLDGLERVAW